MMQGGGQQENEENQGNDGTQSPQQPNSDGFDPGVFQYGNREGGHANERSQPLKIIPEMLARQGWVLQFEDITKCPERLTEGHPSIRERALHGLAAPGVDSHTQRNGN